jgi:hypothetical protein
LDKVTVQQQSPLVPAREPEPEAGDQGQVASGELGRPAGLGEKGLWGGKDVKKGGVVRRKRMVQMKEKSLKQTRQRFLQPASVTTRAVKRV